MMFDCTTLVRIVLVNVDTYATKINSINPAQWCNGELGSRVYLNQRSEVLS